MQQTYVNQINGLNEQLRLLTQQNDQLGTEKYILNEQLEKQVSTSHNHERSTPSSGKKTYDRK